MSTTLDRLVILGLDGATWTVLDPMRRRGLMPNLDALLAKSAHGYCRGVAEHAGGPQSQQHSSRCEHVLLVRRGRRPVRG